MNILLRMLILQLCAVPLLSGCALITKPILRGKPGVLVQDGEVTRTARVRAPQRTITGRPTLVVRGRLVQVKEGEVKVKIRLYTDNDLMIKPSIFYRFLIDEKGRRAESSTYTLGFVKRLDRLYRCRWKSREKVGTIKFRSGEKIDVYGTRIREGWCREEYYRRDITLTFRDTRHLNLKGSSLALRMETLGYNYELQWNVKGDTTDSPSDASNDEPNQSPSKQTYSDPPVSKK